MITDTDDLWRRVPFADPNFIRPDGTLTSAAFQLKPNEDGISVDIARLTSYLVSVANPKRYRVYSLAASIPRSIGLGVIEKPVENNPAHALITGNITRPVSKKLALLAIRVDSKSE